jgi:hypothetical protein
MQDFKAFAEQGQDLRDAKGGWPAQGNKTKKPKNVLQAATVAVP